MYFLEEMVSILQWAPGLPLEYCSRVPCRGWLCTGSVVRGGCVTADSVLQLALLTLLSRPSAAAAGSQTGSGEFGVRVGGGAPSSPSRPHAAGAAVAARPAQPRLSALCREGRRPEVAGVSVPAVVAA